MSLYYILLLSKTLILFITFENLQPFRIKIRQKEAAATFICIKMQYLNDEENGKSSM